MCKGPLQLDEYLAIQKRVVGQDWTYKCMIAQLARIYTGWEERSPSSDMRQFQRGLAHLVLLSPSGTGRNHALKSHA